MSRRDLPQARRAQSNKHRSAPERDSVPKTCACGLLELRRTPGRLECGATNDRRSSPITSILERVDEGFFTSATSRYSDVFAIARPASEVWRELVSDEPLNWCRPLSVRWISERPYGVGSIREAKALGGVMKLTERFFIWEDGRRYAFYATGANVPLFRRLAEDYVVEPNGPDRCRFTWTVALEPTALGRSGGPLNGIIFRRLFAETRRHFNAT